MRFEFPVQTIYLPQNNVELSFKLHNDIQQMLIFKLIFKVFLKSLFKALGMTQQVCVIFLSLL